MSMGGITEVSGSGYKVRLNFNCDERIRERVDGQIRDLFNAEIKKKEESADAEGTDENQ